MDMVVFELDVFRTTGLAMILFALGTVLVNKVGFLRKICIPAPVVGGLLFAILNFILYMTGVVSFTFDETLKNIFMVWFFTSVGYTASFKVLAKGSVAVLLFLAISSAMQVVQNLVGVGLAGVFDLDLRLGLCMGSIPLVGGHGTAATWGPIFEKAGAASAEVVAIAAATFGLCAGSLMGGPVAKSLITKYDLHSDMTYVVVHPEEEVVKKDVYAKEIMYAFCLLIAASGIGMYITDFMSQYINLPSYIGPMIVALIIRNVCDAINVKLPMNAIDTSANVCLSIFLAIALMTLKLWQLIELALPMIVILAVETLVMFFVARFVVFNLMGRDYEAAVLTSAFCGFGMGATPNAMANMQVLTEKYGPAPKAYLVVPIVGGMFVDFTNTAILSVFSSVL